MVVPAFCRKVIFEVTVSGKTSLAESPVVLPAGAGINAANLTQRVVALPGWSVSTPPMSIGVSDWSAFRRLTAKNRVSFGSVIRLLSTSAPVREIDSSVKTSGANPIFSMLNNEHGFFFGLGGLRDGGTVPNSIAVLFPGMVTLV